MNRDELLDRVAGALQSVSVNSVRELLGDILLERISTAPDPSCNIVFLLERNVGHILQMWEQTCAAYLNAVRSRPEAVAKARFDLLGPARKCDPGQFNAVMGDFFGEMATVGELSKHGYSNFVSIATGREKTFDYECDKNGAPACVEVKNIRAPVTIFDAFKELFDEKRDVHPELRSVLLVLRCRDDNTATDEQYEGIDNFLAGIAANPAPHYYRLALSGNVDVEVEIKAASGRLMMVRGWLLGDGPLVDADRLFAKIGSVVDHALEQLAACRGRDTVLAMNLMSPDASIPLDWVQKIRDTVQAKSAGATTCELVFHYGYLSPN